jgi:hypothetical protein
MEATDRRVVFRDVRGSVIGAAVLLFFDVVMGGSCITALAVCPIWLLVSLLNNAIDPPAPRIALFRLGIPVLTLGLALANNAVQLSIARANAARVAAACEAFHAANGRFPETLDELVPRYLPYVPRAKYCVGMFGMFLYWNHGEDPMLLWYNVPPYGRRVYDFETHRWHQGPD